MSDQLLTPADVAARCQISTKTVLRAIRSGRLRASRLGEHARLPDAPGGLEAWIDGSRSSSRRRASAAEPDAAAALPAGRRPADADAGDGPLGALTISVGPTFAARAL